MVRVPQIARLGSQKKLNTFIVKIQVQINERALQTDGLCDTGAEIRLSMSPAMARKVLKHLGGQMKQLKHPIQLTDYQKKPTEKVTHKIVATLELDHRRFKDEEFIVANTGHDIFIGQHWLAEKDVWLHPRTKAFQWPEDIQGLARFSPAIVIDGETSQHDKEAQRDVRRREKLMEQDDQQNKIRRILENPWRSVQAVHQNQEPVASDAEIAALNAQILADPRQERWRKERMPKRAVPLKAYDQPTISINALASSATWKTYDGKHIPFPEDEDPEHVKRVRETLPPRLAHLEGFFSKMASTKLPPSRPGHDVVLELERPLEGSPPSFRTPLSLLPLEKETTDELQKIGFIEHSMDATAAPILFVPKPHTEEKRFCCDYRWVNRFLVARLVNAPDVRGTIANCSKAKRLSVIDVIRAFNRLLMDVGSRYLTAFKTRQGTFRWKVLPFGLKVGPAWWQNFINAQLNELLDLFASAYADDVLIYTEEDDDEKHFEQVEEVIYRLHKADLQGDIKKSRFNVTTVTYLGMVIEAGQGIGVDPEKTQAILNWKVEDIRNRSALRSFLGLCNYIRMFCHHASDTAEPLNRLLKKDVPFEMGPEQVIAFEEMKKLATNTPVMAFFVPGRETRAETDASRNATGGLIMQKQPDGLWKPTGYFSKTMTPAERAYPIQDRELLAVVQTLEQFEPELLGTKFFVVTDHQALLYYSTKRILSTRQVRWADFLSNFDITFQYRRGQDNIAADALSRKTVDLPTVKARELEDRTMALIPPENIDETPLNDLDAQIAAVLAKPLVPNGADLVDLIILENEKQKLGKEGNRLVVPETTSDKTIFLRTALIREAHEPVIFAHGGQHKTMEFLRKEYFWEGMRNDVKAYIRNCQQCGRNKTRHDKTPGLLHPLPIPSRIWEHVLVDGKDMPKDRHGYDYVWAFICKFSRIIARLPGRKNDTAEILAQRYYRSLYRFLGIPDVWITDNAGPFISLFMAMMNKLTGTKHRHGSALHSQTQGGVEITNAILDQQLRFYINKYQDDWSTHMPALDYAHNISWHSSIGMAPLTVANGAPPRNPLSLPLPEVEATTKPEKKALERAREIIEQTKAVQDLARQGAEAAQAEQKKQANKKRREVDFKKDDKVYIRKKGFVTEAPTTRLDSQYAGPWRIKEVKGFSYVLDVPTWFKGSNLFHADRLRKASDDPLPQQVEEPEPPDEIDGQPEWEVEKILASRLFGKSKVLQYQVDWRGCDPDEEWYPARDFKNAATAVERFHDEYPEAAGPPKRLQEWIRAAAEDRLDPEHPDDNRAEHEARGSRVRKKHATRHK